jgi:hypothetical protein
VTAARLHSPTSAAVLLALAIVSTAPCARGAGPATEKEKQAQELFVEAMKLLATKQYGEACDKLARSQALDPGMGTQFRLAECYEKLGRLASAFTQYSAVADAAKAAGKHDREALARRRASALEPKVARLTITLPPEVAALPGLEVTRDGLPLADKDWGVPEPVEPGDHLVTVRAPGKKPWESKIWAEAAAKHTVEVGALEDVKVSLPPPPPPRSLVPTITLGVAGGLGLVLGATFVGLRAGKVSTAHTLHDAIAATQGNCLHGGLARYAADCTQLVSVARAGDHLGTASLVSFVAGGAALAGMAGYLLWPKISPARTGVLVAPTIGAGEAALVMRGSF